MLEPRQALDRASILDKSFESYSESYAAMKTFSHYGVGVKVHAIERRPDGRVEFTLWLTVFWIPVVPLSSWSAVYRADFHDAIRVDGQCFQDPVRIERGALCHIQTFTRSILTLALAIAPAAILIYRTSGRAATPVEMIFVFASAAWPVLLVILIERHRRKLLKGPW